MKRDAPLANLESQIAILPTRQTPQGELECYLE